MSSYGSLASLAGLHRRVGQRVGMVSFQRVGLVGLTDRVGFGHSQSLVHSRFFGAWEAARPAETTSPSSSSSSSTPTPSGPSSSSLSRSESLSVQPLIQHDLRAATTGATHQRPFMRTQVPSVISSITLARSKSQVIDGVQCPLPKPENLSRSELYDRDYKHLRELCVHHGITPPERGVTFFSATLGNGNLLRWERNTEVQTYILAKPIENEDELARPFDNTPINTDVPKHWMANLPGYVTSAVHVALTETLPDGPLGIRSAGKYFAGSKFITGCDVDRGRFRAYSDFRQQSDDFIRFVVVARKDDIPNRRTAAGKVVQRLIELEKYRVLSLMGLPFAQALSPRVDVLNTELQQVNATVSRHLSNDKRCVHDQRAILQKLTQIGAESLRLNAMSSHRFNASNAYSQIVQDRITYLHMGRVEGLPSMSSFLLANSNPAMRTLVSTSERLHGLIESSQLTAELMRTSVTVEQQHQSNSMLESLRSTSQTQLLLQECVEGLSVVAVSYYSIGILGYAAKAAAQLGLLPFSPEIAMGAMVPFVGGAVYITLSRVKTMITKNGGSH